MKFRAVIPCWSNADMKVHEKIAAAGALLQANGF